MKPDFSLILPCYNESSHIRQSLPKIIATIHASFSSHEIILIDDKSTDDTRRILKQLVKNYKHVHVYYHRKNRGRGATVQEGIQKARSDIVAFIDIDLEVEPDYLVKMAHLVKSGVDVVVARRYYPLQLYSLQDLIRTIASKIYASIIRIFLDLPIHDTEAGYKCFKRKRIMRVLRDIKDTHWFWDTEIIARSLRHRLTVQEVPVLFLRKLDKKSTVKLASDSVAYIHALYTYKKSLNKMDKP